MGPWGHAGLPGQAMVDPGDKKDEVTSGLSWELSSLHPHLQFYLPQAG
jgi:hypothetical protein